MWEIIYKINQSIILSYIFNVAIIQGRGRKLTNHFVVHCMSNMQVSEMNEYLTLISDNVFEPFSSKEEIATKGSEQIRHLDATIIGSILGMSDTKKNELYEILRMRAEVITELAEKTKDLRLRKIESMNKIDRNVDNQLFLDIASCVRKLSQEYSLLNFFEQRYLHYMAYIDGLNKGEEIKEKLKKKS